MKKEKKIIRKPYNIQLANEFVILFLNSLEEAFIQLISNREIYVSEYIFLQQSTLFKINKVL